MKELVDEIVRLSVEFGILTEYTSFLATEGTDLGNWSDLATACRGELHGKAKITVANKTVSKRRWERGRLVDLDGRR